MQPLWIFLIVSIIVSNAAVVVRRRPIAIHERVPFTSKATTTTTPEPFELEEETTVMNRLSRLTLPSNATSIRSDITDNFSCAGRQYGYYADVENECQIFHVCLPVTYPDGQERQFRWSFICPEETTFNQEAFTCVRTDEMNIDCTESEKFYELNRILGLKEETTTDEVTSNELTPNDSNRFVNAFQNKENNQRYKPLINNPNRYAQFQTAATRNQILKKTTKNPYINLAVQTTNFNTDRESNGANEFIPSTTYPPVNIAQFFEFTTRKNGFNPQMFTTYDNAEYITEFTSTVSPNDLTTTNNNKYDSNTQIIPELIEEHSNSPEHSHTDEIVESIKQLQKFYPSAADDSREKRFLLNTDSVKNRQKLFNILNKH